MKILLLIKLKSDISMVYFLSDWSYFIIYEIDLKESKPKRGLKIPRRYKPGHRSENWLQQTSTCNHLLTQTDSEVSAMCINEALSPIDKLAFILTQGERIQKWSIFENLAYYIESADHAERMLLLLEVLFTT